MKRKLLNVLLIGIFVLGLTGCGNNNSTSNEDNKKASKETTQNLNSIVTCTGVQNNVDGNIEGRKALFENNKMIKLIDFSNAKDSKDAEKYCNLFKKIESKYANVSIDLKDSNCNVIYDISNMSDNDLEELALRNRNNDELYNTISYNDYYNYVSSSPSQFCFKGENVEKKFPKTINGEYQGLIHTSNGGTYDWSKVAIKFEDTKYTCSYSIDNNNYEINGNYTYDSSNGKLELTMDKENSKGNLSLASSCYGIKRAYENIEGYDLELVDIISDKDTDYQKTIRLSNN